jgi:hypothetical protein
MEGTRKKVGLFKRVPSVFVNVVLVIGEGMTALIGPWIEGSWQQWRISPMRSFT